MTRIYQQTFVDAYTKTAICKLYDRKNALVAADLLNDRVIPFYEEHDIRLLRILSDRGTEYCGAREHHEYELYLSIEDIEHTTTKARSQQTNGICERFHRTILNEFYSVAFRKKIYSSIEQLQIDLEQWLDEYNTERPHTGKYCFGKTPYQTFIDSIPLAKEKYLDEIKDSSNFVMSDEAEMCSAGEQRIRYNLTDWNNKEVDNLPTSYSQNIPVIYT